MRPLPRMLCLILILLTVPVSAQDDLSRYPTVDEVASYLRFHTGDPPSGFISYFWMDDVPLRYTDLNDDGEDDLIAHGWLFMAIMLWEGDGYRDPFYLIYTADSDSGAWSSLTIEDWTLDGIPDITFDRKMPFTGANYEGVRYERSIISCALLCYVAWDGRIAESVDITQESGIYRSQSEMRVYENEAGRIVLDVLTEDFAFNCRHTLCTVNGEVTDVDGYQSRSRAGASTRTYYLWDGLEFLYQETITLIESRIIPPQSQLTAIHESGHIAEIDYDEQCQLWLDNQVIGNPFDCVIDFTQIYWYRHCLILEFAYFRNETLIIFDMAGEEIFRVSGVIHDETISAVYLDDDDNVIFSSGTDFVTENPYRETLIPAGLMQPIMTFDVNKVTNRCIFPDTEPSH